MRRLFQFEISENRIFGLDVLRFIAIFMVLLGHSLILVPKEFKKSVNPFLYDGVAIFFVLSGFLIGGILVKILQKQAATWSGLLDFWKRRWMRTLPVYLVVLLFLLGYTLIFYPVNFPKEWFRFFFFTQNIFGHYRPGFFAEAWSLSIEEWFYLSVPLILFVSLMVFKTSTKWTILFVSLGLLAAITYYRYYLYHSYGISENPNPYQIKLFKKFLSYGIDYQVIPRLDSIMFGVLAAFFAHYYPKVWNAKWNILLVFVGLYLLYYSKFHMGKSYGPFSNIWCPTLKSLAVFFMLPFMSNLRKGLGKWTIWISFFSLISYSMYLVNLNVVTIAIIKHTIHGNYGIGKFVPGEGWVFDYLLFWIFTISISFVLYQLIEVPFMKMRDKKTKLISLMKALKITLLCSLVSLSAFVVYHFQSEEQKQYFQGDDSLIRYVGRFDFSERHAPKVWAPGAYLECHIYGKKAVLIVEDEQKFGNLHNYIEVIVDGHLKRIRLKGKMNRIVLFHQKQATQHNVIVCKNTESAIGYIQIHGIECGRLLKVKKRKHLFEFIGDSITCGNGSDSTQLSFGKRSWYDYHNAYLSFGARLARAFHADWMLSAVSGIGMNHSCCGLKHSMPEVYEFLDFHVNSDKWKFREQPTCVFITLGQNDGTMFMSNYEHAYVAFLTILRKKYPHAWFICCTSPMADRSFRNSMKASIQRIIARRKASGEKRIIPFIYQGTYTAGYDKHPTIAQHAMMMQELRRFLMEQNSVTHLNEIVF